MFQVMNLFYKTNLFAHISLLVLIFFLSPSILKAQGFQTITNLGSQATSLASSTGEKPQSKVWSYNGTWWSVFANSSGTYLWRLDGSSWTSVLQLSTSASVRADCKVVNDLCHIFLWKSSGSASKLISVEYVANTNTYKLWTVRKATTNVTLESGTETGTIDIDGNGRMWLVSDGKYDIRARWSDYPYNVWSVPIIIATGITSDDISVVIALPVQGQIGVLWSNQNTKRFGFKTHNNGDDPVTWSVDEVPASQSAVNIGFGMSDDHMNLALGSDGTLFCGVKTSYDTPGYPKLSLLKRQPSGVWDNLYEVTQTGTRPLVILNESIGKIKFIYASLEGGGDILYKESSTSTISFGTELTLISGGAYQNATSSKNNYNSDIVILASSTSKVVGVLASDSPPLTVPSSPTLLTPTNLATEMITTPMLTWAASANATSYHVQVSTSSSFSTIVFDQNNFLSTSIQASGLVGNTTYYWRALASNLAGSSTWSTTWSFNTVSLPLAPSLFTPADLSIGIVTNPTLSWNASATATSYQVQVSTASDFATTIFNQSNIATTSVQINTLMDNTQYFWRVLATNSAGSSAWSLPWSFTTFSQPPSAPTLLNPVDLAINIMTNPTLSWTVSSSATSYHLQVSTMSDFSTTVFDQTNIVTTSIQINSLAGATQYYWRVLATNSAGSSSWTSSRTFTTVSQPSVPVLLNPVNLATNVVTNPTISWNASANATSYHVQLSIVSDFSTTIFDQSNVATTSSQINGLSNNTLYYWRVLAANSAGDSDWSAIWSFTTSASSLALVGYWKMNEGSGTIIVDDSGFGNNGLTQGGPLWDTGVAGTALKLNGTNQYASVPDAASLDITQAITLAAWIRPEKLASQKVITKYSATTDGYLLTLLSTGKVTFQFNQFTSSTYKLNSNTLYPTDGVTWMHIAATYDGSIVKIYINGVLDKSISFVSPPPINMNAIPLTIGVETGGIGLFKGTIDDARIYNYALTSSEISGLFSSPSTLSNGRIANRNSTPANEVQIYTEDFTLKAYPNPVEDVIYLELTNVPDQDISISILDPLGRIYTQSIHKIENNRVEIKLNDLKLNDGLHLLNVRSSHFSRVIKFIKK